MSRNDKISILIAIIFLTFFMYFLYAESYLYALGWIILSIAFFLEAYNPHETGRREVTIIINVILSVIGIGILIYALIYGN